MAFVVIGVIVCLIILFVLVAQSGYPQRSFGQPRSGGCQSFLVLAFLVLMLLVAAIVSLSVFIQNSGF